MAEPKDAQTAQQATADPDNNGNAVKTTDNQSPAPTGVDTDNNNGDGDKDGLEKLSVKELVDIIHETRGEAKTRRLKQRELEEQIQKNADERKLNEQKQLEANQEWEEAYNKLKEETGDYGDLKRFKESFEKECQVEIEKILPTLTDPEKEIFELSSKTMSISDKILFIKKLIENRPPAKSSVDNTQSTGRGSPQVSNADTVKVPFGNTQSVIGNLLETLKAKRQNIK